MGVRNRARRLLLQARYAAELNGDPVAENLDQLGLSTRFEEPDRVWLRDLAAAIERNREALDSDISAALENWTLDRLHLLARLILEQAVGEVRFTDVPMPVAIDEAVDLAGDFVDAEAARFVNGVLDRVLGGSGGN